MDRWRGKVAVVTGAGSGIGAAIVQRLLDEGLRVVGLDVRPESLEGLKADRRSEADGLSVLVCDVASQEEVARAFEWVERQLGGPSVLVNCAGVTDYTPVIESDGKAFERLININVVGMASCIAKATRSMRDHKVEGHIFNINSVLGHELPEGSLSETAGANGWNLYPASKHATVAMTHTVRREISRIGAPIRITSISPGLVKTEIAKHTEALKDLYDKVSSLDPSDIADALIYALGTRPEVQITEITVRRTGEL